MIGSELLKKRVYAMTTDLFIVIISNYFLMASFTNFIKTIFFHFPLKTQLFFIHKLAMMGSVSLLSLSFAYFSLFYFLTNGKTMGKMIFGIKVVNANNEDITLVQSMTRSFAYFGCSMLASIPYIVSFIRKDEKSIADLISGSTVAFETATAIEAAADVGTEFQLTLLKTEEDTTTSDEVEYFEQNKAA